VREIRRIRVWWFNQAGCHSRIVEPEDAPGLRLRLIAAGAITWETEVIELWPDEA